MAEPEELEADEDGVGASAAAGSASELEA